MTSERRPLFLREHLEVSTGTACNHRELLPSLLQEQREVTETASLPLHDDHEGSTPLIPSRSLCMTSQEGSMPLMASQSFRMATFRRLDASHARGMVACPRARPTWTRCPKRISSLLLAKTRGERSPREKRKVENGQKWGFQTHFSTFAGKHRRRKKLSVYAEQGRPWNSPFFCKEGSRVVPSQSLELPSCICMASWSSLSRFLFESLWLHSFPSPSPSLELPGCIFMPSCSSLSSLICMASRPRPRPRPNLSAFLSQSPPIPVSMASCRGVLFIVSSFLLQSRLVPVSRAP